VFASGCYVHSLVDKIKYVLLRSNLYWTQQIQHEFRDEHHVILLNGSPLILPWTYKPILAVGEVQEPEGTRCGFMDFVFEAYVNEEITTNCR
jgi:hypothetical protein